MYEKNSRYAFTLAETLITLIIIGVIAAMTIQTLINNIEDQKNKSEWKKTYSTITQSSVSVMNNNGIYSYKNAFADEASFFEAFKSELSVMKSCTADTAKGNCWHKDGEWYYLNKDPLTSAPNLPGVILSNGMLLRFNYSPACDSDFGAYYRCGYIIADTNGFKRPNTYGKDIFEVNILENGIKPSGSMGSYYENTCTPLDYGFSCANEYLYK